MKASKLAYPEASSVFCDWRMLLAFGFGSGLSRIVPGTMGTLASLPLALAFMQLPVWQFALIIAVAAAIGVHLCEYATNKLGVHDHGGIVWDEFVGMWIALLAVPFTWQGIALAFVLFRFFDMLKPWPISYVDKKVHGGFGIMIDDVIAGVAALACTHAVLAVLPLG